MDFRIAEILGDGRAADVLNIGGAQGLRVNIVRAVNFLKSRNTSERSRQGDIVDVRRL
jgi:hypothetical protein